MQPRMTSLLCLKRSLALRSSTLNSKRLWQQRFFNSTLEVLVDPFVGIEVGSVDGQLLQLYSTGRPASQEILDRPRAMYRRAIPDHQHLERNLAHEVHQEAHRTFSLEGSFLLDHVELAFEGYAAHHRKMIVAETFMEDGRLSYRGISANYHW
jgi:hypothetical protein